MVSKDMKSLVEKARSALLSRAVPIAPIEKRKKLDVVASQETQIIQPEKAGQDTVIGIPCQASNVMDYHCARREAKHKK